MSEIVEKIERAKKTLAALEKRNMPLSVINMQKSQIAKFEKELADSKEAKEDEPKEIEKPTKPTKPKTKPNKKVKKEPKSKPKKSVIDVKKALEQGEKSGLEKGFDFDDKGIAHTKYNSIVKKVDGNNYMVLYNGETDKDAELHLKDGVWKITCCELKEYPIFKSNELKKAVDFILNFKDCLYGRKQRIEQAKGQAKSKAKYDAKPDSVKAVNTVEKAAESVENRVDEVIEEGNEVTPKQASEISVNVTKIVAAIENGIKDNSEKKKFISNLIKKLQSKLKQL
ncbi:MAG: hypothetical protein HC892_01640 [Saprospiraceae bacterium]|nr:hypothetical protein [Saprospiraceae bacterium]